MKTKIRSISSKLHANTRFSPCLFHFQTRARLKDGVCFPFCCHINRYTNPFRCIVTFISHSKEKNENETKLERSLRVCFQFELCANCVTLEKYIKNSSPLFAALGENFIEMKSFQLEQKVKRIFRLLQSPFPMSMDRNCCDEYTFFTTSSSASTNNERTC